MMGVDGLNSDIQGAKGPLSGVKILDLSTMILGPLATQYLGYMFSKFVFDLVSILAVLVCKRTALMCKKTGLECEKTTFTLTLAD